MMELYSPIMRLTVPNPSAIPLPHSNGNTYHLVFHEWLDLADSNDVVRVDMLRPITGTEKTRRLPGSKPIITVVPNRNDAFNTHGHWRRVIAPLDIVANETNVYFRFTLQSDSNKTAGGWYLDDVSVIQGGMIDGFFTNAPGMEVVLYGINYNGHTQTNVMTDANGYFQFGLLPLGRYCVGALGSTFCDLSLTETTPTVSLGETNVAPLIITGIYHTTPTLVEWTAVPGLTYEVDCTTNILCGSCWTPLATVTAGSTQETYTDYAVDPEKDYRVILLNGL
jgi:hypothetical protein